MNFRVTHFFAIFMWLIHVPAAAHDLHIPAEKITAILDYSKPNADAADAFFSQLEKNSEKLVKLELEIVPRQTSDESGYSLSAANGNSEAETLLCGDGHYGLVDNQITQYELTFNHPENFHSPTTINIGDRRSFPFQTVYCGIENYTEFTYTSVKVTGEFVVFSAGIPTAVQIVLFPYSH